MKRRTGLRLTVFVLVGALLLGSLPPARRGAFAQVSAPPAAETGGTLNLPLISVPLGPPDFKFITPANGAAVSGTSLIAVQAFEPGTVATVSFQAGTQNVGTDATPGDGFQAFLDAALFPAGALRLTAIATGPTGQITSKSIDVAVVPNPPASAKVGAKGTTLATAGGSTIIVPPGAVSGEATISIADKTAEEVTAEEGVDWESMGVIFLGAIDVQSSAPLAKPLGVSSVGFGNRVQEGQAVVTYRILPDADGDGAGELVVVNGASLATNGTIVSSPLPEIVVNRIGAKTGADQAHTAAVGQDELQGPPGTTIIIKGSGFNPLSTQGNIATFHSLVNGVTVSVAADVEQNGADASDQTVTVLIPVLPAGAARLTLRNESTGATVGPFPVIVDKAAALSRPAGELVDLFFAQSIDFVAALPAGIDPQLDNRDAIIAQLTAARAEMEALAEDSSPEAQQALTDLATVIEGSGVLNSFPQGYAAGLLAPNECATPDYKNQLTLITNIGAVIAGAVCALIFTGAGAVICGAVVAILALIQAYRIGRFPDCPQKPPACTPTATAADAGTTGMGAAPPPGGDSCGNAGGGPANSVHSAGLAQFEPGRFTVKIFPQAGGSLLTPFTGSTDPGGYFYIPLIPAGEPFRALATDQVTGASVSVEGVGPVTGESAYLYFDFTNAQQNRYDIAVGDTISNGVPGPGAGNIEEGGGLDIYNFTAIAGQRVFFDVLGVEANVGWELLDPTGVKIFDTCLACGDPGAFTLARAGIYTLRVGGENNDVTGVYRVKLWDVPAPQQFEIAIGQTISNGVPGPGAGQIETPGVLDIYTFEATAGQRVFFDVLSTNLVIDWNVHNPAGGEVFSDCLGCGDPGAFTLGQTGTYSITVGRANRDAVGTYQLKLWHVPPPQQFGIAVDDTISDGVPGPGAGRIETPGVLDVYTFNATAGQRVFFDVLAANLVIEWSVHNPAGGEVFSDCLGCGDPGAFTLEQTGAYTITVGRANRDAVGTYQIKLWDVPAPQQFEIALGDTISNGVPGPGAGNIETPGVLDIYTFSATAGQQVVFDVLQLEVNVGWDLRDPSGGVVFDKCLACGDPGLVTLAQAGTYTITVGRATSDATGVYQFKLEPQ